MKPNMKTLRKTHFPQLDATSTTYLDTTGALPIPLPLISLHTNSLQKPLGNPHSPSPPSTQSSTYLTQARHRILRHFHTSSKTHVVIFTANTTAAVKLLAESFPFTHGALVLSVDNHNSVLGTREYARRAHAHIAYVQLDPHLRLTDPSCTLHQFSTCTGGKLFAYPAQSNFSGVIHPLTHIQTAHDAGFHVLLDAAAYTPSSSLNLTENKADFVCMSFYKMFGYPTGIGCLIARREALCMLKRPWFSGGAVVYASVAADAHVLREGAEGFEDGTVNFLAARAVTNGLSFMKSIGMKRISSHVRMLARCLLHCLERAGEHVRIYGPANMESRGGVFAFDVLYCGQRVDARIFEREASLQGIALRTGCFCNPGASEVALGMVDNVKACVWKGRDKRMVEKCMGGWFGCVRVSVGIANVKRDIDVFADFLDSFCARVDASMLAEKSGGKGGKTGRRLGCSACGG